MENKKGLFQLLFEKYSNIMDDSHCMELCEVLNKTKDLKDSNLPAELKTHIQVIFNPPATKEEFGTAKANSETLKALRSSGCQISI